MFTKKELDYGLNSLIEVHEKKQIFKKILGEFDPGFPTFSESIHRDNL